MRYPRVTSLDFCLKSLSGHTIYTLLKGLPFSPMSWVWATGLKSIYSYRNFPPGNFPFWTLTSATSSQSTSNVFVALGLQGLSGVVVPVPCVLWDGSISEKHCGWRKIQGIPPESTKFSNQAPKANRCTGGGALLNSQLELKVHPDL